MLHYRMISWWLRPWNLPWPNARTAEEFKRRADAFVAVGANSAIIFGAHFRWDFADRLDELHALIRFIADTLHQRDIVLFDHHSAVLSSYYNADPERFAQTFSNFKQLLTSTPGGRIFADRRDDWKMRSAITGKICFLPQYGAEEFCINNPDFVAAYRAYLGRLVAETAVDGLMCDDALFYPGFQACACPFCRERFGRPLPAAADLDFWGNWNNADFKAWLQMRYDSVADFNAKVAAALPPGFPLMNCCSGSSGPGSNGTAMSIERFTEASNHVMLEMCGDTPNGDGTYTGNIAMQLHQLAAARRRNAPCLGLGYGFSTVTANFIWAFNKFLGSDMWFSQLLHRLRLSDADLQRFPEDAVLTGVAFQAEKRFSEWFDSRHEASIALFFPRAARDNYGGYDSDCCADYRAVCAWLFNHGYDVDVVLDIPEDTYEVLILPSAAELVAHDQAALDRRSGLTLAVGPLAGVEVPRIDRTPKFPCDMYEKTAPVCCAAPIGWRELRPDFHWNPAKMAVTPVDLPIPGPADATPGWYVRHFRDRHGRKLTHYLAAAFTVGLDDAMEARRAAVNNNHLINRLTPRDRAMLIPVPAGATVLEPLTGKMTIPNGAYPVAEECFYFIVREA